MSIASDATSGRISDATSAATRPLREPPLLIPADARAVRLPRGFRRLLDDFSREVLRQVPCNVDQFGAYYFADLLEKRKKGLPIHYEPEISYIKAQVATGDHIIIPTVDQNYKGTQTTGSSHYFASSDAEDTENDEPVPLRDGFGTLEGAT